MRTHVIVIIIFVLALIIIIIIMTIINKISLSTGCVLPDDALLE